MKCSNAVYDFCINQGTDLTVPLVLTDATGEPVDLEGSQNFGRRLGFKNR